MFRVLFIVLVMCLLVNEISYASDSIRKTKKVAILVYDGVYLLDFAGPMEVLFDTMLDDNTNAFEVFLVSPGKQTIKCHTGTNIESNFTIDNCPQPDILIIPGGNLKLASNDKKTAEWLKATSKNSELTMSVCTGAFILADLGLLDYLEAVTWYGSADFLQKKYPNIKVLKDERYTDNGNIITTAGVSAGIDGTLYLVSKLFGRETASKTAKYIEYEYYK